MAFMDTKAMVWNIVHIQVILASLIGVIGASYCSEEQINNCRIGGQDGTLGKLAGGGECQAKRYVQFTHLCTVNNYVPSTDYCCCAHERRILCCRYHYDWNYFRCEADDVVDTIADDSLPQELLLTAILLPSAVALCCLVCCVRCLCCRDDEDDSSGCSKCTPCSKKDSTDKRSMGRSKRYEDVHTPFKSSYQDGKKPLPLEKYSSVTGSMMTSSIGNGVVPSVPSAPPLDDPAFAQLLPRSQAPPNQNYTGAVPQNNNSNTSGYMLNYVPIQHGQTPPSTLIECPYQDLHHNAPQATPGNTYHVDTPRYSGAMNCNHGNQVQNQTLIGILTNPDGRPILADPAAAPPRDPPPAYEIACSDPVKTPLPQDTDLNNTTSGC